MVDDDLSKGGVAIPKTKLVIMAGYQKQTNCGEVVKMAYVIMSRFFCEN